MWQTHSWTALVALLIILIDSQAQEDFSTRNKSIYELNSHYNPSPIVLSNNKFDEYYGNEVEDVNKETKVNISLNELNPISAKTNRINDDKKSVFGDVNGTVFSYPLSVEKRKIVDDRYWRTNNLSRLMLPRSRTHTDIKFSQSPREIVRQQRDVHVFTDTPIRSNNKREKHNIYMKNYVNVKNKTIGEMEEKYLHLKNEKRKIYVKRTDKLSAKFENSLGKILRVKEFENFHMTKNKILSSEKKFNLFGDEKSMSNYKLLSINKSIVNTKTETSDKTFKVPLKDLKKLPSSSLLPCVKSQRDLSNKKCRDENRPIKTKQVRQFLHDEEFSQIPMVIKTFSSTTESTNEKYYDNYFTEKTTVEYFNYNNKQRDITSSTFSITHNNEIKNEHKKSTTKKIIRKLNSRKSRETPLISFNNEKEILSKKNTSSTIDSMKNHEFSKHNETYNINLISTMMNSTTPDTQEHIQTSIIKSNQISPQNAKLSPTIEFNSRDYKLYPKYVKSIKSLRSNTSENIRNQTNQNAPVTLSDIELLSSTNATKTNTTFTQWPASHDKIGPVISTLSSNHEKSEINIKKRVSDRALFHHLISNSTLNENYEHHEAINEYRLSIPLSNSQSDAIENGVDIENMKIELYSTPWFDVNIDNTTVKSINSNLFQVKNEKWKNHLAQNNHESVTSLSTRVNGISNTMFNDTANRMSLLTTENILTIAYNDTQTLADRGSEHENSTRVSLNQWPVKHSAIVEGNLVLGGLMMVHEREDTVTCGPIMAQGGVQALEAMLYTLDWINERDIVPGVKIGAHILDDCDKDTYGLEMAVDFIKGSISNIDGADYNCNKTTVRKVISGVVGAASSVTSIQVANLLRLFRIPQVSFFSTSPELSNKQRFEYFTRTIPSDHYQVKAMVDIIIKMGWSYVSIIYEESNYGIKAYEELEDLLAKNQICIAIKEKLVKDSGVAEEIAYDNIVQKLLTKPRARGCIIFGSDQEVAGVMRAVRRNNATGAFYWIGSDGWSARGLVSNKNEPEVEGTLSVQPQANSVDGFEKYFLNLTVENNKRNPWFFEFWEDHFQCRYPNTSRTPYNQKYKTPCTTKERLTKNNTAFEDQLQFVSDAVMAFAYAFRDMHADLCHGNVGLCDAMKPTKGTELLKYLRKVEFQGLSGDNFRFDKNGDGPARYNIIHFKQVSPGKYKWIRVGKYLEGELRLNMSEIQFRLGNSQAPESVCSLPCRVGQAKKYVEGESCCWHCLDCTQYQIRHATDQTRCVPCPQGTLPDETHSRCRAIPEEFLKLDSGWAIGAMSFSATGILITVFIGGVFVKHNDTPIVRASGRELSYVLLIGILLCYLVTFTLVLKPTDIVCGIQRFAAGFCFTVVYAALLTKTNRISRIFNKSKKSAKRPSFISPRSQLIICSLLVGIQILINAVWMVIDPAKARHHYPMREDNLLVCNSYIDASYMIAFTYPIILIIVCTVYAVLTRKIPEDFNESKHIGFTMYTTCVIWLAFVPLYFGTGNHVALRITSMSVTISLSASVTIACLFSPKLYIILIHPERNIRRGRGPFAPKSTTNITRTNASGMISTVTLTAATCDQNKAVKGHTITTTDCSTQSELYEMEMKECKNGKNGKFPLNLVTRSTQTLMNNNGKEINILLSPTIKDIDVKDSFGSVKSSNISKISNGPVNQNDVVL